MKIDKAIKTLKAYQGGVKLSGVKVLYDAIQLGIEALERIKELRRSEDASPYPLLPGETRTKQSR